MAKIISTSPFAPKTLPHIFPVSGVKFASMNCGLYKHKHDLMLAVFPNGTSVAGVFTKSTMASAPVIHNRNALHNGKAMALIVNSGNSIAMTGQKGFNITKDITTSIASEIGCKPDEVFMASTGVIGSPFESSIITNNIPHLINVAQDNIFADVANAIMTTDTFPKIASIQTEILGTTVNITGFAKGSGMIEPNMATMLAFIFTDAAIPHDILQQLVSQHTEHSFNSITVDSDTSTSDTVLVFATGAAQNSIPASLNDLMYFSEALLQIMQNLAKQIVMDGEGAQKLIEVNVHGAASAASAKIVAKSIANSPLIKTAIAGGDANWGRVAMAIGKTLEPVDLNKLMIKIGNENVIINGEISQTYNENNATDHLMGMEIVIDVSLGVGAGNARVWGCDLTHGYIDINVDYRS